MKGQNKKPQFIIVHLAERGTGQDRTNHRKSVPENPLFKNGQQLSFNEQPYFLVRKTILSVCLVFNYLYLWHIFS